MNSRHLPAGKQKKINERSGGSNIKPNRKYPPGHLAVPFIISTIPSDKGKQDKRKAHTSQYDVTEENKIIYLTDNSLLAELNLLIRKMVSHIRKQESCGKAHRHIDTATMCLDVLIFYKIKKSFILFVLKKKKKKINFYRPRL